MVPAGLLDARRAVGASTALGWFAAAVTSAWLAMVAHAVGGYHDHAYPLRLVEWAVMVVAMMGPLVLPALRHVEDNSLRWRRRRAAAEFVVAYLVVWLALGTAAVAVAAVVAGRAGSSPLWLAGALAGAAVWQLTPAKRGFLWDCHRSVPLPLRGWAATLGCVRFGLRHGRACAGSCGAMMAAMALPVGPATHLVLGVGLLVASSHERRSARPRRAGRHVAVALTSAAVLAVVLLPAG